MSFHSCWILFLNIVHYHGSKVGMSITLKVDRCFDALDHIPENANLTFCSINPKISTYKQYDHKLKLFPFILETIHFCGHILDWICEIYFLFADKKLAI